MRFLIALMVVVLSTTACLDRKGDMKEVRFGGGLIMFSVPNHWLEEYEKDGTGLFYADEQDSGTLRLTVITVKSADRQSSDAAFEWLATSKGIDAGKVERLKSGNAIATSVQHTSEDGKAITLFWWRVTNAVPPDHLRIALFSYTVLSSQLASDTVKREVQLLDESIRNARFRPTVGP
jgi:hypothetical protein